MKAFLSLTFTIIVVLPSTAFAGAETHGGKFYHCPNLDIHYELMDYFLLRNTWHDIDGVLDLEGVTADEMISNTLSRLLAVHDEYRYKRYQSRVKNFRKDTNDMAFLKNFDNPHDYSEIGERTDCDKEIAILFLQGQELMRQNLIPNKLYVEDTDLLNKIEDESSEEQANIAKAGAELHEIILDEYYDFNDGYSNPAMKLNAILSSSAMKTMTPEQWLKTTCELGFPKYVAGIPMSCKGQSLHYNGETPIEFAIGPVNGTYNSRASIVANNNGVGFDLVRFDEPVEYTVNLEPWAKGAAQFTNINLDTDYKLVHAGNLPWNQKNLPNEIQFGRNNYQMQLTNFQRNKEDVILTGNLKKPLYDLQNNVTAELKSGRITHIDANKADALNSIWGTVLFDQEEHPLLALPTLLYEAHNNLSINASGVTIPALSDKPLKGITFVGCDVMTTKTVYQIESFSNNQWKINIIDLSANSSKREAIKIKEIYVQKPLFKKQYTVLFDILIAMNFDDLYFPKMSAVTGLFSEDAQNSSGSGEVRSRRNTQELLSDLENSKFLKIKHD